MDHTCFPVQTCVALVAATDRAAALLLMLVAKPMYDCSMMLQLYDTGKKSIARTFHKFVHEQS
jgi:hypothetical protein